MSDLAHTAAVTKALLREGYLERKGVNLLLTRKGREALRQLRNIGELE